jgi:hypothetical protein
LRCNACIAIPVKEGNVFFVTLWNVPPENDLKGFDVSKLNLLVVVSIINTITFFAVHMYCSILTC